MTRRASRKHCFCVVYQLGFREEEAEPLYDTYVQEFLGDGRIPEKEAEFILDIANGVAETREFLDSTIEKLSRGFSLLRLAKVDLALLRMAVYELAYTQTPTGVCINEVVELAKHYGDDESSSFINGLLANAAKRLRG